MQGRILLQGDLDLALNKKDAQILEKTNTLECKVRAVGREQILKLIIKKTVNYDHSAMEDGFTVHSYPRNTCFETRTGVEICISREKYQKLLEKEYIGTRWSIGMRVDITYCG